MAKRIKKEVEEKIEPKNCQCDYPLLIDEMTTATDGHKFTHCLRCKKENRLDVKH